VSRGAIRRLTGLLTLATVGLTAWAGSASPAAATPAPPAKPPVVLFAVPGLLWSDVLHMPHLAQLAARSSVGELSVKTGRSVTHCAAGLIAVSAGNRTTAPVPHCGIDMSTWPGLRAGNRRSRYDARVGALGQTLQSDGVTTAAVTNLAVPMLANYAGDVDHVVPSFSAAIRPGRVVAGIDTRLFRSQGVQRAAAQAAVDARIAALEQALPPGSTLMVAGVSDVSTGFAQLHVLILNGPGWPHTELRSSAAGRAPYVQLIDVAPTLLTAAGVKIPSFMVGRPMQRSGSRPPPISSYIDDNRHAVLQRDLGQHVFLTVGIAAIVMMLLAASKWGPAHRVARFLARLIAPAPAMIFIANAFPWWHWNQIAYGAIVLAGVIVVASLAALIGRGRRTLPLVIIPIYTFVVLAADQFTGAHLQLSAPLGDSPLVAGRFSGMGNLDFTMLATSAMLIAGIVGGHLKSRFAAVLSAGAIAVAAIVIDGTPQLGNDIGGVLTLVPASLAMLAVVAEVTITRLRVAAVAIGTVVVAVGVAVADYSRPATSQTHVGRFVGQVLHGGAGTEVHRKFDASMATFGLTIGTFVVGFALVLWFLTRRRIRAALDTEPGARAGAIGAAVVGLLGVFVNDSGIVIAAMAAIVATSAFYSGGLGARTPAPEVAAT
jgi:hypothetical protein